LSILKNRIDERVELGGHYIPEDVVKQRFLAALRNLPLAIKSADLMEFFDQTGNTPNRIGVYIKPVYVQCSKDNPKWIQPIIKKLNTEKRYLDLLKIKGKGF
jgi:predicted ABC-type ATPase